MHALTVVEDLDVIEGFGLHLGMRGVTNAMNPLVFENSKVTNSRSPFSTPLLIRPSEV